MSDEHVRQFIAAVEQDPTLKEKIQSLDPATATADVVKLGEERGLHFTAAEFSGALNSVLNADNGEITDEALGAVAGGSYVKANPNIRIPDGSAPHQVLWVKFGAYNPNPGEVHSFSNNTSRGH
jgi:predicted ribosomally synthesized peptide with nif11-like leader